MLNNIYVGSPIVFYMDYNNVSLWSNIYVDSPITYHVSKELNKIIICIFFKHLDRLSKSDKLMD